MTSIDTYLKATINTLPGWCTPEKATRLSDLIVERVPKLAVEIGIFGGRSLLAMALTMKECNFGVCYGVDPWTVGAAIEGEVGPENEDWWKNKVDLEDVYRTFIRSVLQYDVSYQCRWIRGKSDDVAGMFQEKSIQLFHLDGNHSELVSCRDVEMWHSKLTEDAVWVLDDTDWATQAKAIRNIEALGFKTLHDGGTYRIFSKQ